MRTIFVGASPLSVMAARRLLKASRDVVIIEEDEEKIAELSQTLDCGFIHGDGSRPGVLEDLSPGDARIIVVTRGEESTIVGDDDALRAGDRVLAISHRRDLEKLKKKLGPASSQ